MTVRDALQRIATLPEGGFCHGSLARNRLGVIVDPEDPRAMSWCIVGAAICVCGRAGGLVIDVLLAIKRAVGLPVLFPGDTGEVAVLSDTLTREQAVELVRRVGASA